jgi:hypothetical protein
MRWAIPKMDVYSSLLYRFSNVNRDRKARIKKAIEKAPFRITMLEKNNELADKTPFLIRAGFFIIKEEPG